MGHAVLKMEQGDRLDLAIQRVQEALERVRAAWQAEHPELPFPEPERPPAAWHPDPNQAPVTTRQWAELTRMRAAALRQHGLQACEHAKQVHQATLQLHAFLQRPVEQDDPAHFTRAGRAISLPSTGRHHR